MLHDRQVKKQLYWTDGCYRAALLKHYDMHLSKKEKSYNVRQLKQLIIYEWHESIDPEVGKYYLENVLKLPSNRLNLIVTAFQNGQQYRHQETIDAIMTELFERSIPESREKHE